MKKRSLILTCEHGGARVPQPYQALFRGDAARRSLASHRGSDHGALQLAQALKKAFAAPLYASTVTRLLVDLNRSLGHPHLFSEFSRVLTPAERATLLEAHYFPHRDAVQRWIGQRAHRGHQVLHVGVHSFTPRIGGQIRTTDVGLLYDPARPGERVFCERWKSALKTVEPGFRVRRNYPFRGTADGLVTHLRRTFDEHEYLGIELEVNQALLTASPSRRRVTRAVRESLGAVPRQDRHRAV